MSNALALLIAPGGVALSVSSGGVDFFYAPGAEDGQATDNGDGGSSTAGGKRRRWVVRVGKRLIEYATAADAISAAEALRDDEPAQTQPAAKRPAPKKAAPAVVAVPAPAQTVYLDQIKAMARQYDEMAAYRAAMERQHYAEVLALFERLQDEEDIEQLLLSVA